MAAAYVLLQIPAISLAWWSFQLNKKWWNSDSGFTKHDSGSKKSGDKEERRCWDDGQIFGAGVCNLGKAASVFIIVYTIFTSVYLCIAANKDDVDEQAFLGVATSNACFLFLLMGATLLMNPALAMRTLPFLFLEIGVCCILYTEHFLIRHDLGEANITDRDKKVMWAMIAIIILIPFALVIVYQILARRRKKKEDGATTEGFQSLLEAMM
jgi:magnesium-transporting ATPase (P-type)